MSQVFEWRGRRWPVVDGIPYLRIGREALADAALDRLDAGDRDGALLLLLADADDWWDSPPPPEADLRALIAGRDTLSLRDALALLAMGRVRDYFLYRWSDPTYLAGLALLDAHWNTPATCFELACGVGHYLRELTRRGVACTGADVVFAKCWVAKHWVAPEADYLVFDAAHPWPDLGAPFDLVMCHDALYFMPERSGTVARLRAAKDGNGVLALSRVRTGDGPAEVPPAELSALFPEAVRYPAGALLAAMMAEGPSMAQPEQAWGRGWNDLVEGPTTERAGVLQRPVAGAHLRPNPLLQEESVAWPSDRYREDYAAGCFWALPDASLPPGMTRDPVRLRRVVDLPERW